MSEVQDVSALSAQRQPALIDAVPDLARGGGLGKENPFTHAPSGKLPVSERTVHGTSPAPIVPMPVTEQQAHTAPIAVVTGTRRLPRIAFVLHESFGDRICRRIRKIAGLRYRSGTFYQHPVYGQISGSWVTDVVPDMSVLNECILDTVTGTIGNDLEGITDVASLAVPLVTREDGEGEVDLWPRLLGYEKAVAIAPPGALWARGKGHWSMPTTSLLSIDGTPRPGMIVADRTLLQDTQKSREQGLMDPESAATMSRVGGALDPVDVAADFEQLVEKVGDVPDWFGMDLRPYQRTAAVAMVAGLGILGDEPGTGKSVMALGAAAITGAERVLIACPPIALSHWVREVGRTGITGHMGEDAEVVQIVSGRKQKDLPQRGIVLVPPSLLRAREQLKDDVIAWAPEVFLYDEAHSAKTWHSKTSTTMREVARACGTSFMLTGTPFFKSADEIAPLLEMCGLLDPVFGGYSAFMETYMTKNRFNAWVPKLSAIEQLRELLDRYCWVRRTKAQVQADMPPKVRSARIVDVKPAGLITAHRKVLGKITEWLDEFELEKGALPGTTDVERWAKDNIGLSSPLREATGLAKIPAATEHVVDWTNSTGRLAEGSWVRPLIVWAHHHVVMDALSEALSGAGLPFAKIAGGTTAARIGQIVDEFQAGKWPVLLASIRAAGTGITLTRSSDVLFVEADWTNAIMSQAESRAHRYGQTAPVLIETMLAPGTLDVSIQSILRENAKMLLRATPTADVDVAVLEASDEIPAMNDQISAITEPWQIIRALVEETLKARSGR